MDASLGAADSNAPWPRWGPWLVLGLGMAPAVAAIWASPAFVTQDGPAHLYNAEILLQALQLGAESPYATAFVPSWRPVPNWGGHLALMGLLWVVPWPTADRLMTTLTAVAPALALLWLRAQVWGRRGQSIAALGAGLLAPNLPWLLGFQSFLIGLTIGLLTLGLWWRWRDRPTVGRGVALAAMVVLGYLGHLVALGLTVLGLGVLAVLTPGDRPCRHRRFLMTGLAVAPMAPLMLLYRSVAKGSGGFSPSWEHLRPVHAPAAWVRQLGWVDPITLGRRAVCPLWELGPSPVWLLILPVLWLAVGFAVAMVGGRRPGVLRFPAWSALAVVGLAGGLLGPDSFGPDHGHYLPQRVALFGLAMMLVAVDLAPPQIRAFRLDRLVVAAWLVGLGVQSLTVWDYSRESSRRVSDLMEAGPAMGRNHRVGTLLVGIKGRFRANPLLHADCLLGIDGRHVIWSNYETRFYYFPVQVRPGVNAPPADAFEAVAMLDAPDERSQRADAWRRLLDAHGDQFDRLLVWGADPALDAVTQAWTSEPPRTVGPRVRLFRSGSREPKGANSAD